MESVCALILNYNSSLDSIQLYRQIQSFYNNLVDVHVIDNASSTEDRELLQQEIPGSNLILNAQNLGYAGGNNIGIKLAIKNRKKYIWILNPDIRIKNNTLPLLINFLKEQKEIAAIGPRILLRENPKIIFSDGGKTELNLSCKVFHKNYLLPVNNVQKDHDYAVDYVDGSCILLNTEAIRQCGLLPEQYFLYFEETDWCLKAKRNGWKIAVNSYAEAYNHISFKGEKYHFYYSRNKILFAKKYHPLPFYAKAYYLIILIYELVLHVSGLKRTWYWKSRFKGYWKAINS